MERVMKSSRLLCLCARVHLCVCVGQLVNVDVLGPLQVWWWHQRQTAGESGLYQRRLNPDRELQSGLAVRWGRPGSLAERRAEN